MATSNFDDLFQPLPKIGHARAQHFSRNFLECCSHWDLQIIKILIISYANLALDVAAKEKIHWGEIRCSRGPGNVALAVPLPIQRYGRSKFIQSPTDFAQWGGAPSFSPIFFSKLYIDFLSRSMFVVPQDALRFLLISHHFLFTSFIIYANFIHILHSSFERWISIVGVSTIPDE